MTATLNSIIDSLKQKNIRITPQRIAILEVLIQSKNHPTAEEVYKQIEVDFPGISVATVYNNLRLFTDLGFVTEMSYGDSASRFDFTTESHYHAICSKCGKITDFHYPNLDDIEIAASRLTGYKIDSHRLEVYGLCPACQKEVVE